MKGIWNHIIIPLIWLALGAQAQWTRSSYYRSVAAPPSRFYHHSRVYRPLSHPADLATQETKHSTKLSKGYSKKIPYRPAASVEDEYASAEYSREAPFGYESKEQDSREYTIGTHIRVQHPITVPKKSSSQSKHAKYVGGAPVSYKGSYSDVSLSSESPSADLSSHAKHYPTKYTTFYDSDPFHVVAPPKSTASAVVLSAPSSGGSNLNLGVFEPASEDYEVAVPHKGKPRDRFKGVASKKQIEKYLEDQEKILDEALRQRLLKKPKYQELLQAAEQEDFDDEGPLSVPPYRPAYGEQPHFRPTRPRRRPHGIAHSHGHSHLHESKSRPPKGKPTNLGGKPKRAFRSAIVIDA